MKVTWLYDKWGEDLTLFRRWKSFCLWLGTKRRSLSMPARSFFCRRRRALSCWALAESLNVFKMKTKSGFLRIFAVFSRVLQSNLTKMQASRFFFSLFCCCKKPYIQNEDLTLVISRIEKQPMVILVYMKITVALK